MTRWPVLALAALAILAVLLRASWAGAPGLSPPEASRALAGWQLAHGSVPGWWGAPALATGTALTFVFFGDNDTMARLLPALCGAATVAALVLLWRWVGWPGILTSAVLLALSPSGIAAGRRVSEEAAAALLTLLLGWMLVRSWDRRSTVVPGVMAIGFGLLLQLGHPGIAGCMALVLFLLAWSAVRPQRAAPPLPIWISDYGLLFPLGAAFVLAGTGGLVYLNGFGFPAMAAWSDHFDIVAAQPEWYQAGLALVGFEPVAIAIGLPAAALALRRWPARPLDSGAAFSAFLALWAVLSILLLLMSGTGDVGSVWMAALPLSLLAGSLAGAGFRALDSESVRQFAVALPLVCACVVFGVLSALHAAGDPTSTGLWLGAAAIVMGASVAGAVSLGATRPSAVAVLFAGLFGLVAAFHGISRLGAGWPGEASGPAYLNQVVGEQTLVSPYTVVGRGAHIDVETSLQNPMAWYLRGVPGVSYLSQVRRGPTILIMDETRSPGELSGYRRVPLPISESWSMSGWAWQDAVRWLATGEVPQGARSSRRVTVYIGSQRGA